jgi:hypothetical protein
MRRRHSVDIAACLLMGASSLSNIGCNINRSCKHRNIILISALLRSTCFPSLAPSMLSCLLMMTLTGSLLCKVMPINALVGEGGQQEYYNMIVHITHNIVKLYSINETPPCHQCQVPSLIKAISWNLQKILHFLILFPSAKNIWQTTEAIFS